MNAQIPQCLMIAGAIKEVCLHTFVDASQEAFGAVAYTRCLYEDGTVSCRLSASNHALHLCKLSAYTSTRVNSCFRMT